MPFIASPSPLAGTASLSWPIWIGLCLTRNGLLKADRHQIECVDETGGTIEEVLAGEAFQLGRDTWSTSAPGLDGLLDKCGDGGWQRALCRGARELPQGRHCG